VVQTCTRADWLLQELRVQLTPVIMPEVLLRAARSQVEVALSVQLPLWIQVPFELQVAVGVPMYPGWQTAEQTLWKRLAGREQLQEDPLTVFGGRAGAVPHEMGSHEPR
jgi:hypothetical protein